MYYDAFTTLQTSHRQGITVVVHVPDTFFVFISHPKTVPRGQENQILFPGISAYSAPIAQCAILDFHNLDKKLLVY